jgi:proline dehydrogenase
MNISFDNTFIAFQDKSNEEIRRAYWLFRLVGNPWLVKAGSALLKFALWIRFPVVWALKPTVFRQFCGGETIEGCEATVRRLSQSNVLSILDYSAEGKESEIDFNYTRDQVLATMKKAAADPAVPYAVFKPTGMASFDLLQAYQSGEPLTEKQAEAFRLLKQRLLTLCEEAKRTGIPVMIDAEESWIQEGVDRLVEELMFTYNKEKPLVFNTLQMYRHDRLDYLKRFAGQAKERGVYAAFKLVRGAYLEKERERAMRNDYPSPVYPDKASTDAAFDAATRFCLENLSSMAVCVATHNEISCQSAAGYMQSASIPPDHPHVSFAQLYGMSDHISYNLAAASYNVCKYLPFGPVKTVVPYLIRRAEENTSVAGQTSRELFLIRKERQRRLSSGVA